MHEISASPEILEAGQGKFGSKPSKVPVYFAVVTPRPGAHAAILARLQMSVVLPLVQRRMLLEFRVLAATPPSFVAEASTLVVFELVVPCPWRITEADVQEWQERLGDNFRLVVAPASPPRHTRDWDERRARSVLAHAMLLPPARKQPAPQVQNSWVGSCMEREKSDVCDRHLVPATSPERPYLVAVDEASGLRVRLSSASTLLSPQVAAELAPCLPVHIQWRTAWRLVYSPRLHGVSIQTFYRRMQDEGSTLLLLQDHCGQTFGGFASDTWHVADRYYGTGESFVFRFKHAMPKPVVSLSQQLSQLASNAPSRASSEQTATQQAIDEAVKLLTDWRQQVKLETARSEKEARASGQVTSATEALDTFLGHSDHMPQQEWSQGGLALSSADGRLEESFVSEGPGCGPTALGIEEDKVADFGLEVFYHSGKCKDAFFLFSDATCLAMGGGSGFAFYLEKDLLHGFSDPCSTFCSEVLSSERSFIISDLECWAFDDPTEV
eukprot:TRINITY_DN62452_c0_g1_i1.p1 TRINITY_DN62452_c0_g1~~TRINITY_DN62452_c0_g1_i1.p1  ORF type:complete len:513 (+),score=113.07 TRINITY_DN62452_c0_g1_i1:50-1540(+)